MYRKILVPLDGSLFAESALPFAESLSRLFDAELHLLRVHEGIPYGGKLLSSVPEEEISRDLERLRLLLAGRGARVRWDMATGNAHEAIDTYVRGFGIDLVAMATHGAGAGLSHGLGSVALKCVRMLSVPMYLVRPDGAGAPDLTKTPARIERILIPLDGSMLAQGILAEIDPFLRRVDAEVRLIRVIPFNTMLHRRYGAESERMEQEARSYLDGVTATHRDRMVRMGDPIVARGEPATEILRAAQEWSAPLIAMTTHGRTGVSRLFFGSVAEKVIGVARGAVLLVRAK